MMDRYFIAKDIFEDENMRGIKFVRFISFGTRRFVLK